MTRFGKDHYSLVGVLYRFVHISDQKENEK